MLCDVCACVQRVVSEEYAIKMEASLKTWVSAWDSKGYSPDQLDKVLDPALMAYDAYGLHHAADKPGREGHAISMMGAKDAQVRRDEVAGTADC